MRKIRSPVDVVKNSPQAGQTWRTLAICNIDTMAYKLLLPWLCGLRAAGCAVAVACRCGAYADRLRAEEFTLYHVPMRREAKNPFAHLPALVPLIRLLPSQQYDLVMVHSLLGWVRLSGSASTDTALLRSTARITTCSTELTGTVFLVVCRKFCSATGRIRWC